MLGLWRGLVLLVGLVVLSSCFEANLELKVHLNGRVEQILTLVPTQDNTQGQQIVSQFVEKLAKEGWKTQQQGQKVIARRDLKGPGWNTSNLNLDTGAFSDERFKVSQSGGWLVQTYRLEVSLGQPNPALQGLSPAGQLFSLFSASLVPKLSFSLETPLKASAQNADSVNGTAYTWNINLATANQFYIEYRIVRWDRVLLLLLAGLAVYGGWRWLRRRKPA